MDKARPLANYHFYLRLRIWCSNNTGVPGSHYFGRKFSNNYTCIILFQHSLSCAACYMTSGQNEFTDNCVLNFLIIMFMIVSIKVTIILKYVYYIYTLQFHMFCNLVQTFHSERHCSWFKFSLLFCLLLFFE